MWCTKFKRDRKGNKNDTSIHKYCILENAPRENISIHCEFLTSQTYTQGGLRVGCRSSQQNPSNELISHQETTIANYIKN